MLLSAQNVDHVALITKLASGIELYESAEETMDIPSGYCPLVGSYVGIKAHCQAAFDEWRDMFAGAGTGGLTYRWHNHDKRFLIDTGEDTFSQSHMNIDRWTIGNDRTTGIQFTDPRWTQSFPRVLYYSDSMIINSLVEQLACTIYDSDENVRGRRGGSILLIVIPDNLTNSEIIKSLCGTELVFADIGHGPQEYPIKDVYCKDLYGHYLSLDRDIQVDLNGISILQSAPGSKCNFPNPFKRDYFERLLSILGFKKGQKRNAYNAELSASGLLNKLYETLTPYMSDMPSAADEGLKKMKNLPIMLYSKSGFTTQFKNVSPKTSNITPRLPFRFPDKSSRDYLCNDPNIFTPRIVPGQEGNRYQIVPEITILGPSGNQYSCYITEDDKFLLVCSEGNELPSDIFQDLTEDWKQEISYPRSSSILDGHTNQREEIAIIPTRYLGELVNFLGIDGSQIDMHFLREVDPDLVSVLDHLYDVVCDESISAVPKRRRLRLKREDCDPINFGSLLEKEINLKQYES